MVVVDLCRAGQSPAVSTLAILGWTLVAVGAVLLVAAVVHARRSEPLPPALGRAPWWLALMMIAAAATVALAVITARDARRARRWLRNHRSAAA